MRDSNKRHRVDTESAAEVLGLEPSTLTTWRCTKRYDLPYYKIGSKVYYDLADLEAFVESRKVGGSGTPWPTATAN